MNINYFKYFTTIFILNYAQVKYWLIEVVFDS